MAAAPDGDGMRVDERGGGAETPALRLERLKADVHAARKKHGKRSVEYLEAAANLAWTVSDQADDVRDALEDELKQSPEDGELAARLDQAEAEAKLAQAEAELAQAKADGKPTEALTADKAALQAEVTRLKNEQSSGSKHRRGGGGELPAAKRLRTVVKHDLARPPLPSTLIGRDSVVKSVRYVAEKNAASQGKQDHAKHFFLSFNGHVRTGKTRMGCEVPDILNAMVEEKWLPAVYLSIFFQNGSRYQHQLDKDPGEFTHAKLTARVAVAMGRLVDENGNTVPLFEVQLSEARQLRLCDLMDQLLEVYLKDQPAEKILPVVVHFDEYGLYVDAVRKHLGPYTPPRVKPGECVDDDVVEDGRASDVFAAMMLAFGGEVMANPEYKRKCFFVPVASGTSYNNVRLSGRMSTYNVVTPRLRLLDWDESVALARSFWEGSNAQQGVARGPCPIGASGPIPTDDPQAQLFASALCDAGGYPGFIDWLCELQDDFVAALDQRVAVYAQQAPRPPARLWTALVRHMLARKVVRIDGRLAYKGDDGNTHAVSVRTLVDRGYVMANWLDPRSTGNKLRLSVPVPVLRCWLDDRDVFDKCCLANAGAAAPLDWRQFEIVHANVMAGRLAAMHHLGAADGSWTLGDVLAGAQPAFHAMLYLPVQIGLGTAKVTHDSDHVTPLSKVRDQDKACRRVMPDTFGDAVHLCAPRNPIVDAYVDLGNCAVFFQYKCKEPDSDTVYRVSAMNEAMSTLREALTASWQPRQQAWETRFNNGEVALVYVTNAEVGVDVEADVGVFYIGRGQLVEHLGMEFAGRGFLPREK